ncbi:MAG: hypothetical protein ACR2NU_17200 [Aeoliella sp.]
MPTHLQLKLSPRNTQSLATQCERMTDDDLRQLACELLDEPEQTMLAAIRQGGAAHFAGLVVLVLITELGRRKGGVNGHAVMLDPKVVTR